MNREILRLALPNIVTNITIPLLGMVDLALMGHLNDEKYIGAIAVGGVIFNFLYWGFGFIRMGTTGFTAQAFGKGDREESFTVLARAFLVAMAGGLLLIILQVPVEWLSFRVINGSREVEDLARDYFYIRIYAAPAAIGLYALVGWFIGMQDARTPMIIAIVINLLNIGLDFLFVKYFNMYSNGVALGTVIAQYSGLVLALWFFFRHHRRLVDFWSWKNILQAGKLKEFFRVNRDIFIRTLCLIFVHVFFTARSAVINDTILAVNTLLLQFLLFFAFFQDGFAYAGEALTGRFIGAADRLRLRRMIGRLFAWGGGISLIFTLAYLLFPGTLLHILTDNAPVIEASRPYLKWVILVPAVSFTAFLWDGIYIGATASAAMRNAMIFSTVLVFVPTWYLLDRFFGNHGLWLAMLLFMVARGASQTVLYRRAILGKVLLK
jgi:MATE family multidrug resistance protein